MYVYYCHPTTNVISTSAKRPPYAYCYIPSQKDYEHSIFFLPVDPIIIFLHTDTLATNVVVPQPSSFSFVLSRLCFYSI